VTATCSVQFAFQRREVRSLFLTFYFLLTFHLENDVLFVEWGVKL